MITHLFVSPKLKSFQAVMFGLMLLIATTPLIAQPPAAPATSEKPEVTPEEEGKPFTPLFDGKSIEKWIVRTGQATYTVEDGVIVGRTATSGPNTFLCT
ncbi:MAG: hypothetical protein KDA78_19790, partial [Planctomycetaceae bacterium]|nr:hypothetical protein [Planctomycetaceae bacterium]